MADIFVDTFGALANNDTDCTTAINDAFAAAAWGDRIVFRIGGAIGNSSFRVGMNGTGGILNSVPSNVSVWMEGEGSVGTIAYDGAQNRTVLTIGTASTVSRSLHHRIKIASREANADYANEAYVGVKLYNHFSSTLDLDLISGFTVGAEITGDGRGMADITVNIHRMVLNRIGLDIGGRGLNGWMNGCSFYGGFIATEGEMSLGDSDVGNLPRYGVRHFVENVTNESVGIWFFNPIIEDTLGGSGEKIAFYVPATGSDRVEHHVVGVHAEGQDYLARVLHTGRCTYRSSYSHPNTGADPIDHGSVQSYSSVYYENESTERSFSSNTTLNFVDLANQRTLLYTGTGHTLTLAALAPGGQVQVHNRGSGALVLTQGTLTTLLGPKAVPPGNSAAINLIEYGAVAEVTLNQAPFVVTISANADNTDFSNTRASINSSIAFCNTQAAGGEAHDYQLYFPPGRYGIDGPLTSATGNYSIIMAPGASLWQNFASKNQVMWRIGDPAAQADGNGVVRFELAAEGRGTNNYNSLEDVAFEIVNVSHYSARIYQAHKFVTALRLIADGTGGTHHHYNARIELGYFNGCRQHVVLRTQGGNGAWINNIVFQGGFFAAAAPTTLPLRYMSLIGDAGGCKATFYEPFCAGLNYTALYASRASAAVYGGHNEDPNFLIEHPALGAVTLGDEPCSYIAPRLENKQFRIADPDGIGSYAYDPFWGHEPTPRPVSMSTSRPLTVGDIKRGSMLYSGSADVTLTIPTFAGNLEPPPMSTVYFQRRGTGNFTIQAGSGATVTPPAGRLAQLRAQWSIGAIQLQPTLSGSPPVVTGDQNRWIVLGDLASS